MPVWCVYSRHSKVAVTTWWWIHILVIYQHWYSYVVLVLMDYHRMSSWTLNFYHMSLSNSRLPKIEVWPAGIMATLSNSVKCVLLGASRKMFLPSYSVTCFVPADIFHQHISQIFQHASQIQDILWNPLCLCPLFLEVPICWDEDTAKRRDHFSLPFHLSAP